MDNNNNEETFNFQINEGDAKFGKGAPAQYVETSDRLRPQSTSTHNKQPIKTWERGIFPVQDKGVVLPPQSVAYKGPVSTRADLQNGLFDKRYN